MYYLGVDLGGTNIVAGVVDDNYNIIAKAETKTACPRPTEEIIDDIARVSKEACQNAGISLDDIAHFGIGSPGALNPVTGLITRADNLDFINVNMVEMLYERTGKKFYLENDANAAAYGEYLAGAGKGTTDFIAVTLGTGVGGGIILGGKLFSGTNYAGAELGHMVINMDGEKCNCGRRGCFEAYASATALIRQARAALKSDKCSLMWQLCENDLTKINGKVVFTAAHEGDSTALAVVEQYEKYLAVGIANIINIFQPHRVCVGGGIANQGEYLLAPVREMVYKAIYTSSFEKNCEVIKAELGNDAGVIGAAMLYKMYE